jgi:hypothetical protein
LYTVAGRGRGGGGVLFYKGEGLHFNLNSCVKSNSKGFYRRYGRRWGRILTDLADQNLKYSCWLFFKHPSVEYTCTQRGGVILSFKQVWFKFMF